MSLDANDWFAQKSYHCRLDWGQRGALAAAARGDVLVVVDVLRFSTTAATIIARGGSVVLAEWEAGLSSPGPRQSLSLLAYTDLSPGTTVPLASPNGATCARVGGAVPADRRACQRRRRRPRCRCCRRVPKQQHRPHRAGLR